MIRVTFIAAESLTALHEPGDIVVLSFSTTELVPSRRITRDVQKALGGQRETLLHNSLRVWTVTSEPFEQERLDAIIEFLDSVEDGSPFDLEPWRSESGPSLDLDFVTPRLRVAETVACKMDSEGYQLTMVIASGEGPQNDCYQVSFTAEEMPA